MTHVRAQSEPMARPRSASSMESAASEPAPGDVMAAGSAFEYLADLFLSEPLNVSGNGEAGVLLERPGASAMPGGLGSGNGRSEDRVGPGLIEGLLVGHLPVMAAPWATQYARHVALSECRPAGMLRVRGGSVQVDLVGGRELPVAPGSLDDAATVLAGLGCHWLVRADEAMESTLAGDARLDRLTLLTGADEAAVIASYRTLKLLSQQMPIERLRGRIRIAIMGSPHNKAAEAAQRLRSAVGAFLGMPIHIELCASKIGGAPSVTVFRADSPDEAERTLERGLAAIEHARKVERSSPLPRASVARSLTDGAAQEPAEALAQGVVQRMAADGLLVDAPKTEMTPEPTLAPEPRRTSLVRVLSTGWAGLSAMQASCPLVTRGVELAADERGTLHLVAEARASWEIDAALSSLLAVQAWAALHLPLLSLTPKADGRAAALTRGQSPVMHLLMPVGMDVRRLLDGGVRVHLIVPVEGRAEPICVGVN